MPQHAGAPARWRHPLAITTFFIAATALMTWPQVRHLATHAPAHQDVFFNLWRLRWFAHALITSPANLFNGNQFYPEEGVLAYSDALLVEGFLAAPLLWAGLPPMLVHNLVLLGAIVASGAGMYTLARHLSGSVAGGLAAGLVFAFAPYRFDHYMHMELQWVMWSPWAFWALQRTLEGGGWRFGALTGLFVALQVASSVYYGVFLAVLITVVGGVQLVLLQRQAMLRAAGGLALGGVLAGALVAAYAVPYSAASRKVGMRHLHETTMFSARPRDYRVATESNLLYGTDRGRHERMLFPGLLAPVLGLIGLLLVPPRAAIIVYLLGLILAFELSLGMYGQFYPWLREHAGVFRGLRAPARASIFFLMFLGVLAAWGFAAVSRTLSPRARQLFAAGVIGALFLEYWVAPLKLEAYPNTPPPLYEFLRRQPKAVVAEFPMPMPDRLPGHEPRYAYMSTFHWMPLLNGYSGYYPPSYVRRLRALEDFPSTESLQYLRQEGARYIVVHSGGYHPKERDRIVQTLTLEHGLPLLGDFEDGWGEVAVFRLR